MIKIDKRKAIELLEAAVAERGEDYVYGEHFDYCSYTNRPDFNYDAEPIAACVVGVAMEKAGVSVDRLDRITGPVGDLVTDLKGAVQISKAAAKIFSAAQRVQDSSTSGFLDGEVVTRKEQTWGKALAAAKEVAERV